MRGILSYTVDESRGQPRMPTRSYDGDAGDDLYVSRNAIVLPGSVADIHTDICVKLPEGFFARIVGRSSTLRKHKLLVNEGIIDCGYTGELYICVFNPTREEIRIDAGQRIAQMILQPIVHTQYNEVQWLPATERGTSGFGSSGK